ncbi:MAG: hypothetical protein R3324_12425 [Halobacteriales archaeon]|nr:hypothetical protein [Halobacteriales archaeon]
MVTTQGTTAYFKLRSALDYRFYNRVGQRIIILKKDEILPASEPADIAYFRARPDVLVEVTPEGVPLDQVGLVNGYDKRGSKSFKVYGRQGGRTDDADQAMRDMPPTIPVGRQGAPNPAQPVAQHAAPPQPGPEPKAVVPHVPTPALPSETIPVGHQKLPSEMMGPGLPSDGPRFDARNPGYESPIEEAHADGTTEVTGPRVDPGV